MRTGLLIIFLGLSGCHLTGAGGVASVSDQQCQENCPSDPACRTCSHKSRTSEWINTMTLGCFGKNPKYSRFHDNVMTRHDARKLASAQLSQCKQCAVSCDYRLGYEQAFVDVSLGGCGDVPALPPANYWTNCARTPEGHEKARDWFAGYAAGASAAKPLYEPYNRVAASDYCEEDWR